MATKSINVEMLAKMFLAGAHNIEAKKEIINELNVFPVPDERICRSRLWLQRRKLRHLTNRR